MGERLNLDGGTLNLDWGRSISMGGTRPPIEYSWLDSISMSIAPTHAVHQI